MADELSKLNFADDLAEVLATDESSRWSIDQRGDLEVGVTVSPKNSQEKFVARLLWRQYPGTEPPSVKFLDPASGGLGVPSAWPKARGFRPQQLDICATWTLEGMNIHPEWRSDPRYRWISHGNVLLKSLRTLQGELDDTFEGRFTT